LSFFYSPSEVEKKTALVFMPKREKVTERWRRMLNEQLHDLYCSPNIIWVIRSGTFNLAEHVARTGERVIQGIGGET
jgi:hypothetical protein